MFPIKDENIMLSEMMIELQQKTGINDFSPGSIARSFLEVFNKKLHTAYKDFDLFASKVFLSTSTGRYLDLIGAMHNCPRNGESDDNYRFRIANQVFTAAKSNETAIRLKCLQVPEVKDIIMTKYTRGSGSFSIHVITNEVDTPDEVIRNVKKVVDETQAGGINAIVTKPKARPIDIELSVKLADGANRSAVVESQIKTEIQNYIDGLGIGKQVSLQKVISIAALNANVNTAFLTSFKINGDNVVVKDVLNLEWDERPYKNTRKINIL